MATEADIQRAVEAERARVSAEILGRGGPQVAVNPYGKATNTTNLPDYVANNPDAYSQLATMNQQDPLAWGNFMAEGARPLGASNGLVMYTKPDKKSGLAAAGLAEAYNQYQNRKFANTIGAGQGGGGGEIDAIGNLANTALDYMLQRYGGNQAGGATTPASESGAGRMGRGNPTKPPGFWDMYNQKAGQQQGGGQPQNDMPNGGPSGGVWNPPPQGTVWGQPGHEGTYNGGATSAILGALGGLFNRQR